jgi:hypothetical protein
MLYIRCAPSYGFNVREHFYRVSCALKVRRNDSHSYVNFAVSYDYKLRSFAALKVNASPPNSDAKCRQIQIELALSNATASNAKGIK